MIIYGSLLIPFITAFVLYKYFNRSVAAWEYFVPIAVSLISTFTAKILIEKAQVTSKEYWGSFVERVEYYEEWNEYIHRTCTTTCCCDSKGGNCQTITYDCSYVQNHPAYWQIITTTNETVSISEKEYLWLKSKFGNEQFVELSRNYYTQDGDEYYTKWGKDSINATPVTTIHHYENRVKAADQSVFHFQKVSDSDIVKYNLKNYPDIFDDYKQQSIIGDSSEDAMYSDKKIQYINGLLGHKKQVKIFILVFKNQPIEASFYQEWYWSGANMNEFVVCVGINANRDVKWCNVISWTTCETLKAKVKSYMATQNTLSLQSLADYIGKEIDNSFVRRNFKEFDYLTVEPPMWTVMLTYFITIAVNIGLCYWIVNNEYEN